MKIMKITLTNDHHTTTVNLVVKAGRLTAGQVRKAKRVLCYPTCECSGPLGTRDIQEVDLVLEYSNVGVLLGAWVRGKGEIL